MPVPTPRTIQPTDAESCTPGLDIDQTQQPQERSFSNFPSIVHLWQMIEFYCTAFATSLDTKILASSRIFFSKSLNYKKVKNKLRFGAN